MCIKQQNMLNNLINNFDVRVISRRKPYKYDLYLIAMHVSVSCELYYGLNRNTTSDFTLF